MIRSLPTHTFQAFLSLFMIALATVSARADTPSETELWQALRDGEAFAVMRHALAPGTGDPANFVVDDCTTQRNLSAEGRAQAAAIGARFRANGIAQAQVRSSQWCRCLETAEALDLGPAAPDPALNSFFGNRSTEPAQTADVKSWLAQRTDDAPLVLVTHQVNISALTGRYTRSGEIIVARLTADGDVEPLGSL